MSVGRPDIPSFSTLNLDGSTSPTPFPPSQPPPPVCYDDCNPVKPAESVNFYALSILAVIVIQTKKNLKTIW